MIDTKKLALLNRLIDHSIKYSGGKFDDNNTKEHFLKYFLNKILEQCTSFSLLYSNNKSDSILIARSIIEGYSLLNYSRKENLDLFSQKWLKFSNIEIYKYLKYLENYGATIDPKYFLELENSILINCTEFIVNNGYKIVDKQYCNTWFYPLKITKIVDKLDIDLIKIAYNEYSSWHHWSPLSRYQSIGILKNEYYLKEHDSLENSIFIVFFCLINTTSIIISELYDKRELNEIKNYETLMSKYTYEK